MQLIDSLPCAAQSRPDWHFDAARGESMLKEQLQVAALDAFGVADAPEILAACAALLDYAHSTQGSRLPHIASLKRESISDFIALDPVTRRNLEITETLRGEDGPTLFKLLDHCATTMGSRRLRHWLHHPLRDRSRSGRAPRSHRRAARTRVSAPATGEGTQGSARRRAHRRAHCAALGSSARVGGIARALAARDHARRRCWPARRLRCTHRAARAADLFPTTFIRC